MKRYGLFKAGDYHFIMSLFLDFFPDWLSSLLYVHLTCSFREIQRDHRRVDVTPTALGENRKGSKLCTVRSLFNIIIALLG